MYNNDCCRIWSIAVISVLIDYDDNSTDNTWLWVALVMVRSMVIWIKSDESAFNIRARGRPSYKQFVVHIPNAKVPCCMINPLTNGIYAVDHQNLGCRYTTETHSSQVPSRTDFGWYLWEIPNAVLTISGRLLKFQSHNFPQLRKTKSIISNPCVERVLTKMYLMISSSKIQ